jgi:hypothetical protein
MATLNMQSSSELTLPNMASAPRPKKIRPSAEARLKPARRREEVDVVRPREVPNRGRKKGGLQARTDERVKRREREVSLHEERENRKASASEQEDEAKVLEEGPVIQESCQPCSPRATATADSPVHELRLLVSLLPPPRHARVTTLEHPSARQVDTHKEDADDPESPRYAARLDESGKDHCEESSAYSCAGVDESGPALVSDWS